MQDLKGNDSNLNSGIVIWNSIFSMQAKCLVSFSFTEWNQFLGSPDSLYYRCHIHWHLQILPENEAKMLLYLPQRPSKYGTKKYSIYEIGLSETVGTYCNYLYIWISFFLMFRLKRKLSALRLEFCWNWITQT